MLVVIPVRAAEGPGMLKSESRPGKEEDGERPIHIEGVIDPDKTYEALIGGTKYLFTIPTTLRLRVISV
jgi:hypothetical protein